MEITRIVSEFFRARKLNIRIDIFVFLENKKNISKHLIKAPRKEIGRWKDIQENFMFRRTLKGAFELDEEFVIRRKGFSFSIECTCFLRSRFLLLLVYWFCLYLIRALKAIVTNKEILEFIRINFFFVRISRRQVWLFFLALRE
jgi:hypothetical protein